MRPPHLLGKNHANRLPTNFVFVDTETRGEKKEGLTVANFRLGCACFTTIRRDRGTTSDDWLDFSDVSTFWSMVDARVRGNTRTLIYAHNWNFDFFILDSLNQLKKLGWEIQSYYVKNGKWIMPFQKGNKKIVLVDSGNILKVPLEDIGVFVGIPKMGVDFESVNDEDLTVYCRNDVAIVRKWVLNFLEFIRENDLGNFRYTLAGQCFNAFRHRFMKHDIVIHSNEKALKLEREAYYGGRTEAFFIGAKKGESFKILDVNSMYPGEMVDGEFPTKLVFAGDSCTLDELKYYLSKYLVIAKVEIETNTNAYPFRDKRVVFPIGRFVTSLCTPELVEAVGRGHIKRVISFNVYEKAKIFKSYIEFFYPLKLKYQKEGNLIGRQMAKLFQNELYGKFGQLLRDLELVAENVDIANKIETQVDADTGKISVVHYLNGNVYTEGEKQESYNSFPAIAAHVTSAARVKMLRYMELAGKGNFYYTDTDSLIVNETGFNNLKSVIDNEKLGCLSIEKQSAIFDIRGAKDYNFDDKVRIKGISRKAKKIDDNTYTQPSFVKFNGLLRLGITDRVIIKDVVKVLTRKYEKGVVTASGWVEPFKLKLF